ncbi:MAG: nucleotidyl transferase AbiEii/AbiGii toxin family protein [Planctomycetota bacterium]
MTSEGDGLFRSVQTRLVQHAKRLGVDPNLVLARYAVERLLYRLSRSEHADRFVLKGALLLLVWLGESLRPTRDADLLGLGELSDDALTQIFGELCVLEVEPDAMVYLADTITVTAIRPEDAHGGRRVTLSSKLGNARLKVQVDVGIGDAITPLPTWLDYPSLLDLPQPRLRVYTPETVVAEKFHAMILLGMPNSRMKDFFDVFVLARGMNFGIEMLAGAIRATFDRRRTPVPEGPPLALTVAFGQAAEKRQQWTAFVRKSGINGAPSEFADVVREISAFLEPVLVALQAPGESLDSQWPPGGPWS